MKYKRSLSCGYERIVDTERREICYRGSLGSINRRSLKLTIMDRACPNCGRI
jgi:hypothetical protein